MSRTVGSRIARGIGLLPVALALGGCAAIPVLPSLLGGLGAAPDGKALHETSVVLDRANYRVVQADVRGESRGLTLLLFLTVDPISYAEAFSDLQANAPIGPGDARAFVNVVHDRSSRNFLLFALPKLRVRADVVEFLDTPAPPDPEGGAAPARMERNLQGNPPGTSGEEESMLNVTPEARTELHGMLMRALADRPEDSEGSLGFRLVTSDGEASSQLGLALDAPRPGDEVLEHDGCSVLIVDGRTAILLEDLTLDVVQTAEGTRLGIRG